MGQNSGLLSSLTDWNSTLAGYADSIATLCYQELHGIAVNFLKSYLAVALQGAVLYLVIGFYPALAGSLGTGGSITEQAWAMLGQSVILLVAVFMSGKFTKAITNAMT